MRLILPLLVLSASLVHAEDASRLDALLERARPVLDGVDTAATPEAAVPSGEPLQLDAATLSLIHI